MIDILKHPILKWYFKAPQGFLIGLWFITFPLWIPVIIADWMVG